MPRVGEQLERRCAEFAAAVRRFLPRLPRTAAMFEDAKQLARSSASVGANYLEANEALSRKDFIMRVRIARKEARETWYWLNLMTTADAGLEQERAKLLQESTELAKILAAILRKTFRHVP